MDRDLVEERQRRRDALEKHIARLRMHRVRGGRVETRPVAVDTPAWLETYRRLRHELDSVERELFDSHGLAYPER